MLQAINKTVNLIKDNLTPDLLNKIYQGNANKFFGHCYVASEAAYYLLGGKIKGWKSMFIKHEGYPHWFLKHNSGIIIDITNQQFKTTVDYDKAIGKGFLTKIPSKRTQVLLKRCGYYK